jgi:hypothetical protein
MPNSISVPLFFFPLPHHCCFLPTDTADPKQAQEADRGSDSDVQLINNAKNAVARAKTAIRETA